MNRQFESGLVAAFLVFAWSRPSKTASLFTLAIGLLGLLFYCGSPIDAYCDIPAGIFPRFVRVLVYCACAAIVTTPFVPLFNRRTTGYASLALFRDMWIPPLGALLSAVSINSLARMNPVTYDPFLYAFDGSLGFQPGFWAERLLRHIGWLGAICDSAYFHLPLALTAAYLIARDSSRESAKRALQLFLLIGVAGYACYQLFPATGAKVALPGVFPYSEPSIERMDIRPIEVLPGPRNSMPSLHTSWILAAWWLLNRSSRWLRATAAVVLGLMLLKTLTFHYLVDMAVAFPFTLALLALVRKDGSRACHKTFQVSALIFFGWLLVLRFTPGVFLVSPAVGWAAMLATVIVCCRLRAELERAPVAENAGAGSPALVEPAAP